MRQSSFSLKFIYIFIGFALVFSFFSAINEVYSQPYELVPKYDDSQLKKFNSSKPFMLNHSYLQNIKTNQVGKRTHKNAIKTSKPTQIANSKNIQPGILISQKIQNQFPQLSSPIKLKLNNRLLQTTNTVPVLFELLLKILVYFFSICRNAIILTTITNTFDVWMPLLMFIQTFYCLGFWTHQAHIFSQIYTNLFNCKYDLFNLIRLAFSSGAQLSSNEYMSQYKFTNMFIVNISGQLIGLLILILAAIIIKLALFLTTSEKTRKINENIRPICNGYIFWITPRFITLAGLSLTTAPLSLDFLPVFHQSLAILFGIILIVVFLVTLIMQIKQISSKLQYLSESRFKIGLTFRIDYMKDFQMDCIQCSMLYYPVINLGRLIFGHLCIGFSPNFHYVQFGGVVAAQVFYFMIQITCSGYNTIRHKIMSPILDFIYSFYLVILIGIGMVYKVDHYEITINLQIIGFLLLIILLFIYLIQSGLDIIDYYRIKNQSQLQQYQNEKHLDLDVKSYNQDKQQSNISNNVKKQQIKIYSINSKDAIDDPNLNHISKNKIKKIKNGKLI